MPDRWDSDMALDHFSILILLVGVLGLGLGVGRPTHCGLHEIAAVIDVAPHGDAQRIAGSERCRPVGARPPASTVHLHHAVGVDRTDGHTLGTDHPVATDSGGGEPRAHEKLLPEG